MKKMNRPKRHFVFLRLCAVMLVMAMAISFVPASARSKKTKESPSVEVSSKAELIEHMNTDVEETIIFTTDKAVSFKIPSKPYSRKKQLVIRAENATITNKAKFGNNHRPARQWRRLDRSGAIYSRSVHGRR